MEPSSAYDHGNLLNDIEQMIIQGQLPQFTQQLSAFLNENNNDGDEPVFNSEIEGENNKSLEIAQKLMAMGQPHGWFRASEEKLEAARQTLQGHRTAYDSLRKDLASELK
jgi:hypothetical protein